MAGGASIRARGQCYPVVVGMNSYRAPHRRIVRPTPHHLSKATGQSLARFEKQVRCVCKLLLQKSETAHIVIPKGPQTVSIREAPHQPSDTWAYQIYIW